MGIFSSFEQSPGKFEFSKLTQKKKKEKLKWSHNHQTNGLIGLKTYNQATLTEKVHTQGIHRKALPVRK